jgi:hypothetical protein
MAGPKIGTLDASNAYSPLSRGMRPPSARTGGSGSGGGNAGTLY